MGFCPFIFISSTSCRLSFPVLFSLPFVFTPYLYMLSSFLLLDYLFLIHFPSVCVCQEPYLQAVCDCCSYRLDPQTPVRFLNLHCSSGESEPVVLPVIQSCECTSCQGGYMHNVITQTLSNGFRVFEAQWLKDCISDRNVVSSNPNTTKPPLLGP